MSSRRTGRPLWNCGDAEGDWGGFLPLAVVPQNPYDKIIGDAKKRVTKPLTPFEKARAACLAREMAKADRARSEYRSRYSSRLFRSMGTGALVGGVRGGYVGAVGGEFLEPLGGGIPGAIVGAVVGGIFGAAAGVLQSAVKEPLHRAAYDHFTYNRAINFSHIDCDAEARTAVGTVQTGGRR